MTTKTMPANDTSATPCLDALFAALVPTQPASTRWALEGWTSHLRATKHAVHAANSYAKHRNDFDFAAAGGHALTLTLALLADRGLTLDASWALIDARIAARAGKAAA